MTMDASLMHALACEYAASRDEEALRRALEASLPLCAMIARRFHGRGAEYDDLYQVACMACVSALRTFDASRGLKFTTFVTPTITGTVRNYLRDRAGVVRAPRTLAEQAAQLQRAREAFVAQHRREPTPRELSTALGWEMERVMEAVALRDRARVASIDQPDEEGMTLGDRLPFQEAGFENAERRADLERALAKLSTQEQSLLALRFTQRLSQREAAQRLQMSQMQVSRMERRALAALRREMEPE